MLVFQQVLKTVIFVIMDSHVQKKHDDIRTYFDLLKDKKEVFNVKNDQVSVRIHSYKYCLYKTADKFYLSWKTVEQIINRWGKYAEVVKFVNPNQTSILDAPGVN
jgi:hypothetical protein